MPGFIGAPELIVLAIVALLVLGPKRLPEVGRSLGKGMREFKNSVTGDDKKKEIDVTAYEPTVDDTASPVVATQTTTTTVEPVAADVEVAR